MLKRGMPPVHPGEILREMYMDAIGIGVKELADGLGVGRRTVSLIINGHSGISVEMALRLSMAFGTTPQLWINMQRDYDLWQAGNKATLKDVRHLFRSKGAA
ncbi:MAG: HigA family addiction module antidote protein [Taibaiella sp.]|nr:HigA family addiction module antidote protein [Taibaiella sp.]